MADNHIPSIATLRLTDGGSTTDVAFWGYSNLERKEKAMEDTAYLLASVSKLFTATAVMQLWELEKLKLDADVNKYLPGGFPTVRNPGFPNQPITIRNLLTHTSSIRDDWDVIDGSYVFAGGKDPEISLQQFVRSYFDPRTPPKDKAFYVRRKPGSEYEYSNMGFSLLGVIVEQVSGQRFENFTQEHIFTPLEMDPSSWFIEGLLESGASVAMPYGWSKRKQSYYPYGLYTFSGFPDGGLRASVKGLGSFLRMILRNGVSDSGKRVLRASTLKRMLRAATPVDDSQGLGWYETGFRDGVWGHAGGERGVSTQLLVDLKNGKGLVVLTNIDDGMDDEYELEDRLWDW